MTNRLVERSAAILESRTSRRGFLARSAVVGSAIAVDPMRFALRPGSAYAAVCSCSGSNCACGSRCCDGYTEFCCTMTGANRCPEGSVLGGWWKADRSGYCGGPRYYLDCNTTPATRGMCSCGCANGDCNNRSACCTVFRYGQCHQELPVLGAIVCRVVTCTPPWELDSTCTRTVAVDNNTRLHDAPCLHEEDDDNVPPAPAICFDSEGRQWVFVRGTDNALWSNTDGGGWVSIGGNLTSGPSATAGPDGRIDVVVRGGDRSAYTNTYLDGEWGGWVNLGGQS